MRKKIVLIFLFSFSVINAQNLWKKVSTKKSNFPKSELKFRKNNPNKFDLYYLTLGGFKNSLSSVSEKNGKIILLPSITGNLSKFSIKEDSNFTKKLNDKYGFIKSYSAQGVDDKTAIAKISIGTDGVHIMITSGNHATFYIDPYTKDKHYYIGYNRNDLPSNIKNNKCNVAETGPKKKEVINNIARNADDGLLRNYRLALVCTGEYAQFHLSNQGVSSMAPDAVKAAAVLSAMNTTMTRVNGIFERDLAVKMTIVLNSSGNNDLLFLDPTTDNLTNFFASTLLSETQSICDNIIGDANYDIGHAFSTGAGGLANLGVVCMSGQKGRGVTGTNSPVSDPYDIDFVAHEIGHQFGALHTFNNSCNGNRSNSAAVEPGSGSTIMAYAGICSPNIQNNSDDHFHAISIDEMWTTIQGSAGCRDGVATNTNNAIPTANAGLDVTIPKSTPFVLRGIGSDADGAASLTYNWEQQDNEISTQSPLSTNTGGPNFRSLPSSTSPDRYMPELSTVIGGSTSSTWEVVPSVSRTMNFSLVVRDNKAGGGANARDDVEVTVADVNPFLVTSQNTPVTWYVGESKTITWDKSTTDIAPINCANVKIKLSTDGGLTFPIVLVNSTPNDGSHTLTMPNNSTTSARIMVEAIDNIFYNINSTNFTIDDTPPTFILSNNTEQQNACNFEEETVSYTLNLDFINGFSEEVAFTASNIPAGAMVKFSPTTINASGDVIMTIDNFEGLNSQLYTIEVTGTSNSTSMTKTVDAELLVLNDSFEGITLTAPVNYLTNISLSPQLNWSVDTKATSYDVEIATNSNFSNIVVSDNVTTNSHATLSLSQNTKYYWRVKPKNNCGEGSFSTAFSFITQSCDVCPSFGSSSSVSTTSVQFNSINNNSNTPRGYSDYTSILTTLNVDESYDISVNVNTGGSGTTHTIVWIDWNSDCVFDDILEKYDLGEATNVSNGATTLSGLSITVPSNAVLRNTIMRVSTKLNDDTSSCENNFSGEVEDYTIEIKDALASDPVFEEFNLYPNPSNGEINLYFNIVDSDKVITELYDIRGRKITEKVFKNVTSNFSERLIFDTVSTGIYLLRIKNGGKQTTKKIIIK